MTSLKKSKLIRHRNNLDEVIADLSGDIVKASGGGIQVINQNTNDVYLYGEISQESICTLNNQLSETQRLIKIAAASYDFDLNAHINLFISSEGGELYSSLAVADRIKSSKTPVHTIVEGIAASGATIISIAGAKRFIRKHSLMLIHQLSSEFWGNYAQIEDEKKNLDLLMKVIKKIYLENTKIPEAQLESLLKHDLCLDANECLKYGLVDKII